MIIYRQCSLFYT